MLRENWSNRRMVASSPSTVDVSADATPPNSESLRAAKADPTHSRSASNSRLTGGDRGAGTSALRRRPRDSWEECSPHLHVQLRTSHEPARHHSCRMDSVSRCGARAAGGGADAAATVDIFVRTVARLRGSEG